MKIAFYKQEKGFWLDHTIDYMTGRKGYSHCELVFDNNKGLNPNYDYTKACCFGISGRENNSRYTKINLLNGNWDIYEIDLDLDELKVYQNCKNYLNLKYDYVGIMFDWIIPFGIQISSKWYCSELVYKLLLGDTIKISPNGLSQKKYLKKIQIDNLQENKMNDIDEMELGEMECS